jgi:hypothetical protein
MKAKNARLWLAFSLVALVSRYGVQAYTNVQSLDFTNPCTEKISESTVVIELITESSQNSLPWHNRYINIEV